ncbi:unnamed protein product [Linum tenue]|uniref:RNase H type-1 domain-containing protein n=1 Tax=Linum tenue TaxID=586396 RepID=A0AAV0P4S4_9ROSI|nr:unnamed protein product [Linum tenue]CAI0465371.1 unnamed protein product [Linum tenue]
MGAQLACQLELPRPELEVDCLSLIEEFQTADRIHTEVGLISRRTVSFLRDNGLDVMHIRHVRRQANNAAHIMAHSETRWDCREVWLDRPPVFLVGQLRLDDVNTPV